MVTAWHDSMCILAPRMLLSEGVFSYEFSLQNVSVTVALFATSDVVFHAPIPSNLRIIDLNAITSLEKKQRKGQK